MGLSELRATGLAAAAAAAAAAAVVGCLNSLGQLLQVNRPTVGGSSWQTTTEYRSANPGFSFQPASGSCVCHQVCLNTTGIPTTPSPTHNS